MRELIETAKSIGYCDVAFDGNRVLSAMLPERGPDDGRVFVYQPDEADNIPF